MSLGGKDITEVAYFVEGQMVGCLGKLTRIAIPFFLFCFFFFFFWRTDDFMPKGHKKLG